MSMWILILGLVVAGLGEVPALTEAQRIQLATAEDGPRLDEGAWYPLIENAWTWRLEAKELLPGVAVEADYTALLAEPEAHRGELTAIEGRFAGRARRYGLSRSGPWGDALTEWVLLVDSPDSPEPSEVPPEAAPDQVAVVYFVDPAGELARPSGFPKAGQRVRTTARFYKVWHDTDALGRPTRYLTFVGRWPTLTPAAGEAADRGGPERAGWVLTMGIPLALAAVWLLRRGMRLSLSPRPLASQERRRDEAAEALRARDTAAQTQTLPATAESALPTDPAAALAELQRRAAGGESKFPDQSPGRAEG